MIKKLYSLDSFVIFDSMSKVNKNKGWSTTKLSISQEIMAKCVHVRCTA